MLLLRVLPSMVDVFLPIFYPNADCYLQFSKQAHTPGLTLGTQAVISSGKPLLVLPYKDNTQEVNFLLLPH